MRRGEIWNVVYQSSFRQNSEPYGHGPAVIVSADWANGSPIHTILVVLLTTNLRLAHAPGNVLIRATDLNGLREDSVANVSQLVVRDKSRLEDYRGHLTDSELQDLNDGLKKMLHLTD